VHVGRQKLLFSTNISLHRVLSTMRPSRVIKSGTGGRDKFMILIAGSSKRGGVC